MSERTLEERNDFYSANITKGAHLILSEEAMRSALERGLGLPDDVMVLEWQYVPQKRGWVIGLVGPKLPEVPEGHETPRYWIEELVPS
jgi:hypothetical protein